MGVRVGVASVAHRTLAGMPVTVLSLHKSRLVSLGIAATNAIGIRMARGADRIGSTHIVAGSATFNIATCELSMTTASRTDTERREAASEMPGGHEGRLGNVAAGCMTLRAEILIRVTRVAISRFCLGIDSVRELVVHPVRHLQREKLGLIRRTRFRRGISHQIFLAEAH